jgi:hypothetical protein
VELAFFTDVITTVPGITEVRGPKTDLEGISSFQKIQAPHGLPCRVARAMTVRSNQRNTRKNDRNLDTSDFISQVLMPIDFGSIIKRSSGERQ